MFSGDERERRGPSCVCSGATPSAAVILGSGRVCESALSTLDGCEPGSRSNSSSSSRKTAAYHLTRVSTDWRPICLKGKMLTSANCWPAIIKLNSADKQQLEALEYLQRAAPEATLPTPRWQTRESHAAPQDLVNSTTTLTEQHRRRRLPKVAVT